MNQKVSKELANHRLEQAKEDLEAGNLLYEKEFYKSANNRAYYSIFHSIKAVLALEPIDFKRHKDVLAYFNKKYINTEIFPKTMGRKIINASTIKICDINMRYSENFKISSEILRTSLNFTKS